MDDYTSYDATGLADLIARGDTTPDALLESALARLDAVNPALNAVVTCRPDLARAAINAGLPKGPFSGVPFLLKDIGAEMQAMPAKDGSALMAGMSDTYDATLVSRLQSAGLVIFGRTAVPENAIGVATEARANGGPTRNPWHLSHTPGGSSGGAAAAVAAGIVPAAHGSDGGGSVRIPASCCGLFGFKPTRARLPDGPGAGEGWAGMAIEGFLTKSVRDTAALLDCVSGPDLGAPYAAPSMETSYTAAITSSLRPLRIALCDTTFQGDPIHPDCHAAVIQTGRLLESLGHDVSLARPSGPDHSDMMMAWTDIVACGTALVVRNALKELDRDMRPDDLEGVARGAIAHAATLSGADYLSAVGRIHAYGRAMAEWFQNWDVLLTPTLAEPPAQIGRFAHDTDDYVGFRTGPEGVFAYSPFAAAFNASGQPAMSVPLAMSSSGLPIGLHFAARFGDDATLMALAAQLETAQPWAQKLPKDIPC